MRPPSATEIQYLQKTDIFKGLPDEALGVIYEKSTHKKFEAGEFILMQGNPADWFYVVKSGQLKLYQTAPDGERVTLRYVGPGGAFGVIVVLRETEYPVTAEAAEYCELLSWNDKALKQIMTVYPQVAINAISILSDFILGFMDRIQGLSTRKVDQRVARALLRMAQSTEQQSAEYLDIGLKLTRQDIAEITGTTLFTVSRTLSLWEKEGWIDTTLARIRIHKPAQLEKIAED